MTERINVNCADSEAIIKFKQDAFEKSILDKRVELDTYRVLVCSIEKMIGTNSNEIYTDNEIKRYIRNNTTKDKGLTGKLNVIFGDTEGIEIVNNYICISNSGIRVLMEYMDYLQHNKQIKIVYMADEEHKKYGVDLEYDIQRMLIGNKVLGEFKVGLLRFSIEHLETLDNHVVWYRILNSVYEI